MSTNTIALTRPDRAPMDGRSPPAQLEKQRLNGLPDLVPNHEEVGTLSNRCNGNVGGWPRLRADELIAELERQDIEGMVYVPAAQAVVGAA